MTIFRRSQRTWWFLLTFLLCMEADCPLQLYYRLTAHAPPCQWYVTASSSAKMHLARWPFACMKMGEHKSFFWFYINVSFHDFFWMGLFFLLFISSIMDLTDGKSWSSPSTGRPFSKQWSPASDSNRKYKVFNPMWIFLWYENIYMIWIL